jgi:hypothetical protein
MSTTMTLDAFVAQGWQDHAKEPAAVWARLHEALPLVSNAGEIPFVAALVTHVSGEHLGKWAEGVAMLAQLGGLPVCAAGSPEAKVLSRSQAALLLCAGDEAGWKRAAAAGGSGHEASDRIRILATASSALAGQHRTAEAITRFEEALALASYGPDAKDPAARALAVTGNNLAAELAEKAELTEAEKHLMIEAAKTGRKYWEIAGTWREVERAEYRLSVSYLKAGITKAAREHAALCLLIVHANGSEPGELFFGFECESRAYMASLDHEGARAARLAAAEVLEKIEDPGTREFCAGELAKLTALVGG